MLINCCYIATQLDVDRVGHCMGKILSLRRGPTSCEALFTEPGRKPEIRVCSEWDPIRAFNLKKKIQVTSCFELRIAWLVWNSFILACSSLKLVQGSISDCSRLFISACLGLKLVRDFCWLVRTSRHIRYRMTQNNVGSMRNVLKKIL